jgi:hypothetical protein
MRRAHIETSLPAPPAILVSTRMTRVLTS